MKILNIAENDWAGVSIKLTEALKQHTKHEVRNLSMYEHIYKYPTDIVTRNPILIGEWIDWADVVNCLGISTRVLHTRPKNLVIYYVGSYFRNNPRQAHQASQKAGAKRELVGGAWQIVRAREHGLSFDCVPSALPVDYLYGLKQKKEGLPIVCQSPSSFERKHTAKIKNMLLSKKNMKLQIISGTSWADCLRLKAGADIYVGYANVAYGQSELEAMAMKIPVIAKYPKKSEDALLDYIGYLPYYRCEMENMSSGIDDLISNKKTYDEYAERGFRFVREFHDYPVVAKKLSTILEQIFRGDTKS